jgi:hypothetical protein
MGFAMYITCSLDICKDTGKPFYLRGSDIVYDVPVVPEEHRDFIKMKGRFFSIYTTFVTDETSTSVANFVDKYPAWSDIVEARDIEDDSDFWNEGDHERFYAALKWFSESSCYVISWYY